MGRKGDFVEKTPRGPGRKAKKQKPPTLPPHLREGKNCFTSGLFYKLMDTLEI